MRIHKFIYTIVLSICIALSCDAKIVLPGIFADHMVLQQQADVWIWGTAKISAAVSLTTSWNGKTYTFKTDQKGIFKTKVSTPKAGGPFNIVINDGEKLTLNDVLIGEVWVCSGQSNMEMALRGNSSPILNAAQIILNADNDKLRLYNVAKAVSLTPVADSKSAWLPSNSESARNFSALAYQFGDILQKKLKVPVGIIVSSVGGTMIESWMDAESLKPFPEVKLPMGADAEKPTAKMPTTLYNGMIAPIAGLNIKGFVWLQGESNRHEPELYAKLLPVLIKQWRSAWGMGDLPFYIVQIAPFGSSDVTRSGTKIREAQLNTSNEVANSGLIVAMDVGMENDIHYMDKTTLALRTAYWALGKTYDIKGINFRSPAYKSMKIEGNKAILTFGNGNYLTSYRKPITQMEIAGEDQKFYPAQAVILANKITVSNETVKNPVAVRYAFKDWAVAEIFNNDGLPASSFRTDNW
ncbi:sialate O-acetylesterase [Pedobacter changchengzhani]|uniref:Sialate O-acetylesterase n=1 Tax=Pedobacter changchengzhani TaxID=2529274 RepID=A0A4R5MLM9_9SPHI|nr:sialate O-acetylesterase [Pedobacter changchengzhani]TDG36009.1 sialate O-acetylesterase [Pedobacter changchengzhani]